MKRFILFHGEWRGWVGACWSEYKGHRYLDIRVYIEIEGKADKVPTKT